MHFLTFLVFLVFFFFWGGGVKSPQEIAGNNTAQKLVAVDTYYEAYRMADMWSPRTQSIEFTLYTGTLKSVAVESYRMAFREIKVLLSFRSSAH